MKLAAAHAIAELARRPVSKAVKELYPDEELSFGRDYILPKPFDRRLLVAVPAAVAKAAPESGVAASPIENLEAYGKKLKKYISDTDAMLRSFVEAAIG
ncbi:MAG: hypothetical protein K2L28_02955 [Muribaculaceae bacterium]|nr:hypothetical protein [Muribaculaceae bacterium]